MEGQCDQHMLVDLSLSMGSRSQQYPTNDVTGTSPEKRGEGRSSFKEAKLRPVVFKGLWSLHPTLSPEEWEEILTGGTGR